MNMPAISVSGLSVRFGDVHVLRNLSFEVGRGSIFGFLGPNGAGKSTTLKTLSGLIKPDAGEVVVGGISVINHPVAVKKKIGVMLEDPALFPLMTIQEHFEMVGLIYGIDKHEVGVRVSRLLDFLHLENDAGKVVEKLSYGTKKKVSLGMALIHNPDIFLLDEPFEGLDPESTFNLKDIFNHLKSIGKTVLISSHLLELIEPIIDSVAVIEHGSVIYKSDQVTEVSLREIYFKSVSMNEGRGLEWLR